MANKTLKVALTGGIASGKTLVSDLLAIHGCHIVDLDVIAREVVLPGTEGLKELIEIFGESILLTDRTLNRKHLRDELYKKGRNRALIEQILHPKILQKMKTSMDECQEGVIVIVIPLLVEKNLWEPFDRAIVVDCEIESQLSRLMSRENIDKEKAEVMLMAQASREQRLQLNDYLPTDVIENNSKISDLKEKVADLNQKLLSLQ
ncbi:MAG: dephospho-CoA kinase [Candidatus Thioglobus sp.]|nr:dephospho-CoA kinase [Candidatus Thioglobus sp.]|tara:strand:+ start:184 stop:798 length:615 start_codon:yes stop_codon:yes gene_type:complete